MTYVTQAVVGFINNYILLVKNNQSNITYVAFGLFGSLSGKAAAGAAGLNPNGEYNLEHS